jgi:hypothetical protein
MLALAGVPLTDLQGRREGALARTSQYKDPLITDSGLGYASVHRGCTHDVVWSNQGLVGAIFLRLWAWVLWAS